MNIELAFIIVFIMAIVSLALNVILFIRTGDHKDNINYIWASLRERAYTSILELEQNKILNMENKFDALSKHLGIAFYEEKAKMTVKYFNKEL